MNFDTQAEAIAHALARRPRGLKNGDPVEYGRRRFEVAAIQQWMVKGTPYAVGLVWTSRCPACQKMWFQLSETRPSVLAEMCPKCDVVGSTAPVLDEIVAGELVGDRAGVRRRGRIENHVLDTILLFGGASTIEMGELVSRAVEVLPEPEEGKRDNRRQHVIRAIQNLSKEKNGMLEIKGSTISVFG